MYLPSRLKTALATLSLCPVRGGKSVASATFQSRALSSRPPDRMRSPSSSNATSMTSLECPRTGHNLLTLRGHSSDVMDVAFDDEGERILSGGLDDKALLWNVADATDFPPLTGHKERVASAVFSRDGKYIASGGQDRTVKIWNAGTGKLLRNLIGHQGAVWAVAFSPNGDLAASASWDQTVKVWN